MPSLAWLTVCALSREPRLSVVRRRFLSAAVYLLVMLMVTASAAWAADPAGHVARLKGEVTAQGAGAARSLAKGTAVYEGDTIRTGTSSRLELAMIDGTKVTLGDNSTLTIDAYLYAPKTKQGNGVLTLAGGVFRAVTGGLAKLRGQPFEVKTPIATIGIRGTDFWGEQRADKLLIALLGGKAVFVENAAGRVEITRRNFATRIEAEGQAPIPPFALSRAQLQAALATVAW